MSQLSTSVSSRDRFQDFINEMEREKVTLTPEVRQFIQFHLDLVQEKLSKGKDVTEDDMKFIDEVRQWVGMPEEWRKKFPNISLMTGHPQYEEAHKRGILLSQWLVLLEIAKISMFSDGWIDRQFTFPGNRKIVSNGHLNLSHTRTLNRLPEGLHVKGTLRLTACSSLVNLPKDLQVEGNLNLKECTSLITFPEGLDLHNVDFSYCSSLKELPEGLKLNELNLYGCSSLTKLPEDLEVRRKLTLSQDCHPQIKVDAKRLIETGKIFSIIDFFD